MRVTAAATGSDSTGIVGIFDTARNAFERIPYWLIALAPRVFPAAVFWQSGRTKVEGFGVKDSAVFLFREEYRLPLIDPSVAAHLAAVAEHLFPFMLVVGLGTRFAALALLCMTLVIQLFVYPGAWPTHGTWAACFLLLIARGPGAVSLDHFLDLRRKKNTTS